MTPHILENISRALIKEKAPESNGWGSELEEEVHGEVNIDEPHRQSTGRDELVDGTPATGEVAVVIDDHGAA